MNLERIMLYTVVVAGTVVLTPPVSAQTIVYSPVVQTPVYVESPVLRPIPAGVIVQEPVSFPVVSPRPLVVNYRPVTTYRPVAASVANYSPTVSVVGPTVPVGPPVVVRQKVYLPGQPVRNFLKAITP